MAVSFTPGTSSFAQDVQKADDSASAYSQSAVQYEPQSITNTSMEKAITVSFGRKYTGRFTSVEAKENIMYAWYRVNMPIDGTLLIDWLATTQSNSWPSCSLSLYNSKGDVLKSLYANYASGNNSRYGNFLVDLPKGAYYLRVYGYGGSAAESFEMTVDYQEIGITMYRLYNRNSGEHFYTASAAEVSALKKAGWRAEGDAWVAPSKSNTPVYRLYNPNVGDHHYTTSVAERNHLVKLGWKDEGIGWYSDDAKGQALLRLYNPNAKGAGAHHYTTDANEKNSLVRAGWKDEGIGWYGLRSNN